MVYIYCIVEKFILFLNLRQVNNCFVYQTKIKIEQGFCATWAWQTFFDILSLPIIGYGVDRL